MLLCHIKVVAVAAVNIFSNSSMNTIHAIFKGVFMTIMTTVLLKKYISVRSSVQEAELNCTF